VAGTVAPSVAYGGASPDRKNPESPRVYLHSSEVSAIANRNGIFLGLSGRFRGSFVGGSSGEGWAVAASVEEGHKRRANQFERQAYLPGPHYDSVESRTLPEQAWISFRTLVLIIGVGLLVACLTIFRLTNRQSEEADFRWTIKVVERSGNAICFARLERSSPEGWVAPYCEDGSLPELDNELVRSAAVGTCLEVKSRDPGYRVVGSVPCP